ncbi:MAG: redoxin domain-containing protein, partial [Gallionella sp.]|nr:redoxin domain-containing protein [Gallionella sp.]
MNAKAYKLLIALAIAGLVLALAAAVLLLTQGDALKGASSGQAPLKKEAAPDFTLTLLDGKKFHLGDHKGKPVMINFFA